MKRLLTMAMLLLSATGLLASPQAIRLKTGQVVRQDSASPPEKNVEYVDDGVIVTYTFTDAILHQPTQESDASMWKMKGLATLEQDGLPSIPVRCDLFYLETGFDVSVTLLEETHTDYHVTLAGSSDPLPDDGSAREKTVSKVKEYSGFYPTAPVELSEIQKWRNRDILYVNVWPAQYDMQKETVRAYTSLKFKVSYKATANLKAQDLTFEKTLEFPFEGIAIPLVKEDSQSSKKLASANLAAVEIPTPLYLIITVPALRPAAEKFAEWKRILGYRTIVMSQLQWTSPKIKSFIQSLYAVDNHLTNVLFLGSHTDVPACDARSTRNISYVSDNPYVCMDGDDDYIPEIHAGRIPAASLEDAQTVIDKIVNYQLNPVESSSFYSTALHCAQFLDIDVPYNYEDRRFTLTSEEVRDYVQSNFNKNINRLYFLTPWAITTYHQPTNWNNGSYSYGAPLPAELTSSSYNWKPNTAQVASAINAGCHYVLYRGHGSPTGWEAPSFSSTTIGNLRNQNKLPIVFSITCSTGMFNVDNCFATKFLTKKNGGAVAVVAASQTSASGYNDAIAEGLVSSIYGGEPLIPDMPKFKTSTETITKAASLGGALQAAFAVSDHTLYVSKSSDNVDYTKESRELFHIFGDSSIMLYTEDPYRSHSLIAGVKSVLFGSNKIQVSGFEAATIGIYDTKTDTTYIKYGNGSHSVENSEYCVVSIIERNRPVQIYKGKMATLKYIQ